MTKTPYPTEIENGIELEKTRPECQPDPKLLEARKTAPRYTIIEKKHLLDLLQGKELDENLLFKLTAKTKLKYIPDQNSFPTALWNVDYLTLTGSFGTYIGVRAKTMIEAAMNTQMLLSGGSDFWPEDFFIRGARLVEYLEKDPALK